MKVLVQVFNACADGLEQLADFIRIDENKSHQKNLRKSTSKIKPVRSNNSDLSKNTDISEADMTEKLKMLLSIPIDSPRYPIKLEDFLEQLWKETAHTSEVDARRNEFTIYEKRLDLMRQYAINNNKVQLSRSIDRLLENINSKSNT